jgi:hypothetical protein
MDMTTADGISQGTLINGRLILLGWSWTTLDIGDVFLSGWSSGEPLQVALNYNETGWLNSLFLDSSPLRLDYTNGAAPSAAVPEPAMIYLILLIGPVCAISAGIRREIKDQR